MNQKLKEKTMESLSAGLPVTLIVLLISIFIVPIEIAKIIINTNNIKIFFLLLKIIYFTNKIYDFIIKLIINLNNFLSLCYF